jgi:hypothetical protein
MGRGDLILLNAHCIERIWKICEFWDGMHFTCLFIVKYFYDIPIGSSTVHSSVLLLWVVCSGRYKMSSTSLESKILDLEARLKAENEMRDRDKMPKDLSHVMGSSAHGTGRRPKQCK